MQKKTARRCESNEDVFGEGGSHGLPDADPGWSVNSKSDKSHFPGRIRDSVHGEAEQEGSVEASEGTDHTKGGVSDMRFKVAFDSKGGATITGPADYMNSERCQKLLDSIEAGTQVLIPAFPPGTPMNTMVEVILQTDYAAFLGMKQLAGMRSERK